MSDIFVHEKQSYLHSEWPSRDSNCPLYRNNEYMFFKEFVHTMIFLGQNNRG